MYCLTNDLERDYQMKVQETKRTALLQGWANHIREHKQSGMSVNEWSAVQGYSPKTYYYRLRRVREELLEVAGADNNPYLIEKPVFAALPISKANGPALTVRLGQCSVEVQNGADTVLVEQVLRVVSRL